MGAQDVLYLDRLTERDLALLAEAGAGPTAGRAARLRSGREPIAPLLERSEVFDALFRPETPSPFVVASPFLVFSVLLARAARELGEVRFVSEWVGPRQRLPVFDVEGLRQFLEDSPRRLFLVELLASYTHVVSGSMWVKTRRGWSRRRFSELDPVHLAELIDVVPAPERPAVHRRLGDLALLLAGVFPDYASQRLFRPVQIERIERMILAEREDRTRRTEPADVLSLLERLGRSSYRMVWREVREPEAGLARVLGEVAERFAHARRVLNFVTDRYLFAERERWFGLGA